MLKDKKRQTYISKGERVVKELIFAPDKERQPWDEKLPNTRSNSYPWNEKPSKNKDKYNI